MQQVNAPEPASLPVRLDAYYERLVLHYIGPLKAFAFRLTGNREDAEDIVQDALIRAYYALERYPAERIRTLQARPWLYKITWNTYCNYSGRTKQPAAFSLEVQDETWQEPEDASQEQPELAFENAEQRRELEALVASLPQRYREVVTLHYLEDLSHTEIAELLNQPVGTIRVATHRGIGLLRQALGLQTKGGEGKHAR